MITGFIRRPWLLRGRLPLGEPFPVAADIVTFDDCSPASTIASAAVPCLLVVVRDSPWGFLRHLYQDCWIAQDAK